MRAASWKRRARRSFTLVELLAVVAIIGILVSLITAASYMAVRKAKRTKIAAEAKQLEMACLAYRDRFNELPPDNSANAAALNRHLRRMFPLWDSSAVPAPAAFTSVTPATALVTFLGGPQDANGRPIGYSPNPRNPFEIATTEGRIGPFFEFVPGQLDGYHYYPPGIQATSPSGMYVYFRSENGDYSGKTCSVGTPAVTAVPVTDNRITGTPWVNPDSCQIICGGLDGTLGTGTDLATGSDYDLTKHRWDDQANFLEGTFEDARE
jgi:prepilin-type N-terminal cleavage/methylation domain-containing protein